MAEEWYAWKTVGDKVDKPTVNLTGRWKNELGSTMDLQMNGSRLSGKYRTAVGAPGKYEEFDLTGVVNGDLVSFVVGWGIYGSITAWVGEQTADAGGSNERIVTKWQLVTNISEEQEPHSLWGAFLTGSDEFVRA